MLNKHLKEVTELVKTIDNYNPFLIVIDSNVHNNLFNYLLLSEIMSNNTFEEIKDPDTICFLPFTSGTTGLNKNVILTHRNIVSQMYQLDREQVNKLDCNDCIVATMPFSYIFGCVVLLN